MEAIQTEYKGYKFRSRLEARWAVFFDACGVSWEYEPEGYSLGGGLYYLPDFLLHNVTIDHCLYKEGCDIYVEVKGRMTDADAVKVKRFYEAGIPPTPEWDCSRNPVLLVGKIPEGSGISDNIEYMHDEAYGSWGDWPSPFNFETVDGDYFAAYPGIGNDGKFHLFGDDGSYLCHMCEWATEKAYRIARQARFEHGETPDGRRCW